MGIHGFAGHRHSGAKDASAIGFRYVEPAIALSPISNIYGYRPSAGLDAKNRNAPAIEYPHDAQSGMGNGEISIRIERQTVRSRARKGDEQAHFRCGGLLVQRHEPDGV